MAKQTKIESHTVTAPASWASYLINGDASGFDYSNTPDNAAGDRDKAQCDEWIAALAADGSQVVSADGEPEFSGYCDAMRVVSGLLAGDMLAYTVLRHAPVYFSVRIPPASERATEWHAPEVNTRGAFDTEAEAHEWARTRIPGHAYSVVSYTG